MSTIRSAHKLIATGALGLGLLAAPAVASAAPTSSHAATTTSAKTTVVKTYTVVAGTFHKMTSAQKRLAAIDKRGITGLNIVTLTSGKTTRYRIEETGLSHTAARALWRQLHKDGFFAFFSAR